MKVADAWTLLGLEPTDDAREVKRAYGRLLKQIDVEADPADFIRLHEARELAMSWGTRTPEWEIDDEEVWVDYDEESDTAPEGWVIPHEDLAEAPPPFVWRPGLPTGSCDRLTSLRRELDTLLFDDPPPDPDRVIAVGEALLRACTSASVDDATATERWLLAGLATSIPRSDPLIEPAMRHFRWDRDLRANDFDFDFDVGALQQRLDDRHAQGTISPTHPERRAFDELRGPARTRLGLFELSLAADVRRFLDQTLPSHPTFEHDLNPDSVAWWRDYLRGRHLPSTFWLQIILIPPVLTLAGSMALAVTHISLPLSLPVGFLVALGATLAAILGLAEVRARHAANEEQWQIHGYQADRIEPFVLAVLILPLASLLIAYTWWTAISCGLVALAVAIGGYLNTPARRPVEADGPLFPGAPVMTAISAVAVLINLSALEAAHAAGPLAALCFLAFRAHEAAEIGLNSMSVSRVRTIRIVSTLLLAAAFILLIAFVPSFPPPVGLTLIPIAVALQHLVTANTYLAANRIEWLVRVAAILFYLTISVPLYGNRPTGFFAALLLYALGYSLIRTILAYKQSGQVQEPVEHL